MQEEQSEARREGHYHISRRWFLGYGMLALASAIFLPHERAIAATNTFFSGRSLSFQNLHTGEELTSIYWNNGQYQPAALADINHILRDYRTGEVKKIDQDLLDLLHALHDKVGASEPFQVISGYRSPKTNAMLARRSGGVARNSQHLYGRAIDIRLPECGLDCLHQAAVDLRGGGVGYYPASDFIHVDVGRVRYW